ncbi:hypothetical protein [Glycomyces harbinensis]|uniref:Uncharacterized protein n=1 Tax=Glycomyces harbinensis TaxID=58114 RepID=A0A1G6Y9P3_9ACTN|nr:hypothetical protein [Glycomyces harbinensis]SDD87149.1 hypothetical protein SAMN05216270_108217 [Glycomyces harbinensis]
MSEEEPEGSVEVDVPLGEFVLGRLMEFFVLGDDRVRPTMVDVYAVIADEPVRVLHIDHANVLGTGMSPSMAWTSAGGIESGTAFSTILYGETIRVLNSSRARSCEHVAGPLVTAALVSGERS